MSERTNTLSYKKLETILKRIPSANFDTYMRALEREFHVLNQEINDVSNDLDVEQCRANKLSGVFGSFFTDKPAELNDEEWRAWLKALMVNFLEAPTYAVIKDKFYLLTGVNPVIEWFHEIQEGWRMLDPDPLYTSGTTYSMIANPTVSAKTPTLKLFSEPRKRQGYRVTVSNPNGRPLLKEFMRWLMRNLKPAHVTMEIQWPELPLGFAVGDSGVIHQWNGTVWSEITLGALERVNATILRDEENGFLFAEATSATGTVGAIYTWDGVQFAEDTNVSTGAPLYGAFVTEKDTTIAVGGAPRILEYDGTAWIDFATALPVSTALFDVGGFASDDFWVVGNAIGSNSPFWRWDGTSWTNGTYTGSATKFESVEGIYPTLAYACGGNAVAKWEGTRWADETLPGVGANVLFMDVSVTSSSNVWVVGYDLMTSARKMYHYDGSTWTDTSDGEDSILLSVSAVSATEIYASGNKGVLIRWDGVQWIEENALTTKTLRDIQMYRFEPSDTV